MGALLSALHLPTPTSFSAVMIGRFAFVNAETSILAPAPAIFGRVGEFQPLSPSSPSLSPIEPTGRFYAARTYEDDTSRTRLTAGCQPGKTLDFLMIIVRAAEQIAVVRKFVSAMGADPERAMLNFAFRWTGLRGRSLESWTDPMRSIIQKMKAVDTDAVGEISMRPDTPDSAW